MKRAAYLLPWLAIVWLLWSGHYSLEPLIFAFGVLSVLLVWWLSGRMSLAARSLVPDSGVPARGFSLRLLGYLPWLAWEVVKANLHVARLVLHPRMPIAPRLVRAAAHQETDLCQVIHANSITLTPGTVTLDLRGGSLLVHALDEPSAQGIDEEVIDRRVARLERGD